MQELSDWTPLGLAVLARDAAGVSALLEGGANPNERFLDAKRKGRGFFPLEYAVYLDAGPVVEALLRGGASRDLAIECGKGVQHTPLSLAEAKGKKAALAALQPPPPVQEAPKKEEAAKPAAKSPMLSQRGALTSQRLAAPAPSTMTSQTSPGALRSAARPGPAGSTDAPKKSPRIVSTKNASAVVNYGDLVLGEEIGKGAYGKVVKGDYGGRKVACKVMSLVKDEREQEQLRREIQLQFAAKHPNIVEMVGLSKDPDKNLVIVMELVEGGDLLALLRNAAEPLDWPLRVRMARELASAVAFLHARNVVHRDLKCSENILVDDERHIRLCDFGFARAVETRGRASTVCLPVDHEVLTSRGWLDCAGWLAACASYPLLRIASYDPERDVMCFEPPVGHQTHPAVARELVQLGDEAEWAAGSGEVCYRTTEDHRLFVQPGVIDSASGLFLPSIVAPEKMPAGLLGGHGATAARHVAAARNGVGASGVAMTSGEAALLAVYGFWLLRGTTGLRFATRGDAEKKWLCDQLTLGGAAAVSVCGNSVAVEDERWALLFGARSLAESARVAEWAWTCDVTRLRQIVAGLLCAAGSSDSIVVADEQLRDDLIRLLLMSGCSASFARCDWGYRVSLAASQEELFPVASRIGRVSSSSAVWCVEAPSGLLWARRARRDAATGRVTQASRPIVTGNCGTPYYSAPEVLVGKPYDAKADVFAFGVIVLEMITRRTVNIDRIPPREPTNPCGIDTVGLTRRIPKTLNVPPPFFKLGLVCVEYDAAKRPTSKQVEQMATAIEKALAPK